MNLSGVLSASTSKPHRKRSGLGFFYNLAKLLLHRFTQNQNRQLASWRHFSFVLLDFITFFVCLSGAGEGAALAVRMMSHLQQQIEAFCSDPTAEAAAAIRAAFQPESVDTKKPQHPLRLQPLVVRCLKVAQQMVADNWQNGVWAAPLCTACLVYLEAVAGDKRGCSKLQSLRYSHVRHLLAAKQFVAAKEASLVLYERLLGRGAMGATGRTSNQMNTPEELNLMVGTVLTLLLCSVEAADLDVETLSTALQSLQSLQEQWDRWVELISQSSLRLKGSKVNLNHSGHASCNHANWCRESLAIRQHIESFQHYLFKASPLHCLAHMIGDACPHCF
jgi:hypothetical protein